MVRVRRRLRRRWFSRTLTLLIASNLLFEMLCALPKAQA